LTERKGGFASFFIVLSTLYVSFDLHYVGNAILKFHLNTVPSLPLLLPARLRPGLLSRYLFSECLLFFFVSLVAFTGILFTLRLLKFASLIINKGVESHQIFLVFLSIIPTFLEIALPLATLLGIMLAFARLSGDSEIVVMRASGVSYQELLRPIIVLGLFVSLSGLYVSHVLKPWGYRTLADTLLDIARSKSTAALEPGIFNKLGGLTIYAEGIDQHNGNISHVLLDDKRDPLVRKLVVSKTGNILSNGEARSLQLELYDGYIHEQVGERYIITKFDTNSFTLDSSELDGSNGDQKGHSAREFSYQDLNRANAQIEALLQRLNAGEILHRSALSPLVRLQVSDPEVTAKVLNRRRVRNSVEQHSRFAMPFASLMLAIVAVALGIQPARTQRAWGAGLSIFGGSLIFVAYYGLLSLGITLAESGTFPILLALWVPNLACLGFGWWSIRQLTSERWSSLVQGFEVIGDRLKSVKTRVAV
jgi:lipopolysaccharide export system permease protein